MMLGLLLAYSGLSAWCFAMERHGRCLWQLTDQRLATLLRGIGACLVLLSLAVCCGRAHGAGVVAWFGLLSVSGVVLTGLLPYAPRTVGMSAITAALSAAILTVAGG